MKATKPLLTPFILFWLTLSVQGEVPKLINYQGKLTTPQGAPLDTTVSMQFSVYPDSTGGIPLWTETQLSVRVDKGIFNTLLGSVTEIPESTFSGAIRYLSVRVGVDPEMIPRKAIVSVGYSFRSDHSDTAKYALSAPPDEDWKVDTSGFNIYRVTGNVGIGELPPGGCKLFVQSDSMVGDYAVYARGGTGLKAIATAWQGTGIEGEGGHAGVRGNGYIGILGQGFWGGWFDGNGYFSGNVGIGTTEPDEHLQVVGNAHVSGNLTVDGSINSISLKVYDSGWFPVETAHNYTLTHNLGTTRVISELWFSSSSDGSSAIRLSTMERANDQGITASLQGFTTTQITVATGYGYLAASYSGGWVNYYASGYYRLILLALE